MPPLPQPRNRLGGKPGQFAEEKRKIANIFSVAVWSVPAASNGHFAKPLHDRLIDMEKVWTILRGKL
jgi:hypothetical protein